MYGALYGIGTLLTKNDPYIAQDDTIPLQADGHQHIH